MKAKIITAVLAVVALVLNLLAIVFAVIGATSGDWYGVICVSIYIVALLLGGAAQWLNNKIKKEQ